MNIYQFLILSPLRQLQIRWILIVSCILGVVIISCGDSGSFGQGPDPSPQDNVSINLTNTAHTSTLHPALFNSRFAEKAIDGRAEDEGDNCWVPRVENIRSDRPILLSLSWDKEVLIDSIKVEGFRNWPLTDYVFATWEAEESLKLEAPPPEVDYFTDVFNGGEDGYHTYRIPAIVVSNQGTVLAFAEGRKYSASDAGNIDLLVKRSFDNGKTWEEQQLVYGEEGEVTIGNPVPIVDSVTGDIHLVFARNTRDVLYVKSSDDGATFSTPVDITGIVDQMCGSIEFDCPNHKLPGPGHGLQTAGGRLLVPVKPANSDPGYFTRRVGVIYSDDHGATWNSGGVVPPTLGEMSESSLFETGDSTLVINMRWEEDDGLYRVISTSTDGGLTWSDPEPDLDLVDPISQGSILRYSDNATDERVLFSNLNHQEAGGSYRNRLTVKLSEDDAKSWTRSREIIPGPAGYSDLAVTDNGKILVLFERGTEGYSEKIAVGHMDITDFDESDMGRYEIDGLRYDIARAKSYPMNHNWQEVVVVTNNEQRVNVHALEDPLMTNTLLFYVDGVDQTDGYAYVQEIEVWGTVAD